MVQRVLVFAQRKRNLPLGNVGKSSNHARQQLLHHRKVATPAGFISDAKPSVETLNQVDICLLHSLRFIDDVAMTSKQVVEWNRHNSAQTEVVANSVACSVTLPIRHTEP